MNNLQKEKKKSGLILMVDHPSENTDGSFSKPKPNYNPIWRKKNDLHQTLLLNCQIEIKSLTLIPQLANVSSTSYHQSLLSSKPSKKQQSKFHHSSSPTKLPITRTPIKKSIQIRKKRKRKKKKKKGKKKGVCLPCWHHQSCWLDTV